MKELEYYPPGPVARDFIRSQKMVVCIEGPFGSGKTTACLTKGLHSIWNQVPVRAQDGRLVRRTRICYSRESYQSLTNAAFESLKELLPEDMAGVVYTKRPTPNVSINCRGEDYNGEKTYIESTIIGISSNDDNFQTKLRGYQFSSIWISEVDNTPRTFFEFAVGRVGRYPPLRDGGPTFPQILMDMNTPEPGHWIYKYIEEPPNNYVFYKQPPAVIRDGDGRPMLNPGAENLQNLKPGYYENMMEAYKSMNPRMMMRYMECKQVSLSDEHGVYASMFDADIHIAEFETGQNAYYVGLDFGFTPAAVFVEILNNGQRRVFHEISPENVSVRELGGLISAKCQELQNNGMALQGMIGDPAGAHRSSVDDQKRSHYDILRSVGLPALPCDVQDPVMRWESIKILLSANISAGVPYFQIHPRCANLVDGFRGGYHHKVNPEGRMTQTAVKNKPSHTHDALQYVLVHINSNLRLHMPSNNPQLMEARQKQKPRIMKANWMSH